MSKLTKNEKKELKFLKKVFKDLFPRAVDMEWIVEGRNISVEWKAFPEADNVLISSAVCSLKDEFSKKRGKLEVYRRISNGAFIPFAY